MQHLTIPLIYNLFPRLVGTIDQWREHVSRAASMGFNWVYFNPLSRPGLSGSLYSTYDYYRLNPAFLSDESLQVALSEIQPVIHSVVDFGTHPMIDLVVNHTAIDSPLVQEHPAWYVRDHKGHIQHPYVTDPEDPTKTTVWKDLADIDNHASSDREGLWNYWAKLVETYLEAGFEGFRCDAAYKVPVELWQFLIERTQRIKPDVVFWAENLGCTTEQTRDLQAAGFQFFCNSSKWWNFHDAWCLDQHQEFENLPSISFPETHDTERLAKESGGNEAIQRQRYAFAAIFSSGIMMPVGYEFCFRNRLHVVKTRPSDWEIHGCDLREFIRAVNQFKKMTPIFHGEGHITKVPVNASQLLVLERCSESNPGTRAWVVVNTDGVGAHEFSVKMLSGSQGSLSVIRLSWLDHAAEPELCHNSVSLKPSEVIVVLDIGPLE